MSEITPNGAPPVKPEPEQAWRDNLTPAALIVREIGKTITALGMLALLGYIAFLLWG